MEMYERMKGWHVLVVGDKKSKPVLPSPSLTFLSVDDQKQLGFSYTDHCPFNHYARKNIGYLFALREGAEVIYDTDDDNPPLPHWSEPQWACSRSCRSASGFANVYRHFSDAAVWPRGFPLDHVRDTLDIQSGMEARIGVWQSLAAEDPDVDAIYRLLSPGMVEFRPEQPIYLPRGIFCSFNSQCTFWHADTFPLLYLPSSVSFRFTDILRSYIAQRLLWEQGMHVGFTAPMVVQYRNAHNLWKDFSQEIECYTGAHPVVNALRALQAGSDLLTELAHAYGVLAEMGRVTSAEMEACRAWTADIRAIACHRQTGGHVRETGRQVSAPSGRRQEHAPVHSAKGGVQPSRNRHLP